jgi:hypothetical protein
VLEAAFNKAHKHSQKKILELVEYEDKLNRLQAEVSTFLPLGSLLESQSRAEIFLDDEDQGSLKQREPRSEATTYQDCRSDYQSAGRRKVTHPQNRPSLIDRI